MSLALAAPAELVCCANSNSPRLLLQVPFYVKHSPIFGKSRFAQIRTLLLLCFGFSVIVHFKAVIETYIVHKTKIKTQKVRHTAKAASDFSNIY